MKLLLSWTLAIVHEMLLLHVINILLVHVWLLAFLLMFYLIFGVCFFISIDVLTDHAAVVL